MPFSFDNPKRFVRETLGAMAGAFTLTALGTFLVPAPALPEICAFAVWGTFLGMFLSTPKRTGRFRRGVLGTIWGGSTSILAYWATLRLGTQADGLWAVCALGGLGLGTWLALEGTQPAEAAAPYRGRLLAALGGAISAGLGVFGAAQWLALAESHRVSHAFSAACIAGGFGLWLAAGTGLRHLTRAEHPAVKAARALLFRLQTPVSDMLKQAIAHFETLAQAARHETSPRAVQLEAENNTPRLAEALLRSMVQSAENWQNLHDALMTPQLQSVEDKIVRLTQARENNEDSIALAQLTRASQAVRAQQHALKSMETQKNRALANLEAQLALLERLHVAHLQFRLGDPQRFSVERDAVAEQVECLSDDFDALSSALLEAESYSDRDALAEVERTGRKALERMREQVHAVAVKDP